MRRLEPRLLLGFLCPKPSLDKAPDGAERWEWESLLLCCCDDLMETLDLVFFFSLLRELARECAAE